MKKKVSASAFLKVMTRASEKMERRREKEDEKQARQLARLASRVNVSFDTVRQHLDPSPYSRRPKQQQPRRAYTKRTPTDKKVSSLWQVKMDKNAKEQERLQCLREMEMAAKRNWR